jgi:hypothetical protein
VNDIIEKVELQEKLNQVTMKKGSDAAYLSESLAATEDHYDGIGILSQTDLVVDVATVD